MALVADMGRYRVELVGRDALRYTAGRRIALISAEMMAGGGRFDFVVYLYALKRWLPPDENVEVELEERRRIAGDLREAFKSIGREIDIEFRQEDRGIGTSDEA